MHHQLTGSSEPLPLGDSLRASHLNQKHQINHYRTVHLAGVSPYLRSLAQHQEVEEFHSKYQPTRLHQIPLDQPFPQFAELTVLPSTVAHREPPKPRLALSIFAAIRPRSR